MRLTVAFATALTLESLVRGGLAFAKAFSFALAFRAAEKWLELAFAFSVRAKRLTFAFVRINTVLNPYFPRVGHLDRLRLIRS